VFFQFSPGLLRLSFIPNGPTVLGFLGFQLQMTQARIHVITFYDWRSALALIVGVAAGYINLKFGMKAFVVINDKDTPLILIVILGYVVLLPLTIVGLFYTRQASTILLIVTAVAFACGIFVSLSLHAIAYTGVRFLLPNIAVALLFRAYANLHSPGLSSPALGRE
jgi:hypothetical protein